MAVTVETCWGMMMESFCGSYGEVKLITHYTNHNRSGSATRSLDSEPVYRLRVLRECESADSLRDSTDSASLGSDISSSTSSYKNSIVIPLSIHRARSSLQIQRYDDCSIVGVYRMVIDAIVGVYRLSSRVCRFKDTMTVL